MFSIIKTLKSIYHGKWKYIINKIFLIKTETKTEREEKDKLVTVVLPL